MSLHPDDRPPDVDSFRQALVGNLHPSTQPRRTAPPPRFANLVSSPPESFLVAIFAGVLLLSLLATLFR